VSKDIAIFQQLFAYVPYRQGLELLIIHLICLYGGATLIGRYTLTNWLLIKRLDNFGNNSTVKAAAESKRIHIEAICYRATGPAFFVCPSVPNW